MIEEDRNLFQALGFVVKRAQAILEDDFLQFFRVIDEVMFLIFFNELVTCLLTADVLIPSA